MLAGGIVRPRSAGLSFGGLPIAVTHFASRPYTEPRIARACSASTSTAKARIANPPAAEPHGTSPPTAGSPGLHCAASRIARLPITPPTAGMRCAEPSTATSPRIIPRTRPLTTARARGFVGSSRGIGRPRPAQRVVTSGSSFRRPMAS